MTKLLVVDDEVDLEMLIKQKFRRQIRERKYEFFYAINGNDALEKLEQNPDIDVLLSDINMPGMSGIELKRKIDSTDYLKKKAIPFVFLTTADSPNIVEQAYQLTNLQGYFKKQNSLHEIKQQAQLIIDYWETAIHPGLENASAPHPSK